MTTLLHYLNTYDPAIIVPQHFPAVTPGICRLVISLFVVYPLSYIHRELIHRKAKLYQLLYFLVSGAAVIYYVVGVWGTLHCLCNVLIVWLIKRLFGPTQTTVVLTAATTMVYLVTGYIFTQNIGVYDVQWTMPHSIHTMKLIGLIFDYNDGNTDPEQLTEDQKKNAIKDFSLLEVISFCFTYTGGLTGPQMSFTRFRSFCEGKLMFETDEHGKPDSVQAAVRRLYVGSVFLAVFLIGSKVVNRDTVMAPNFHDYSLAYRLFCITVYGQLALVKYIGCWTVMEGGCILLGISYDPGLVDRWGAMKSVNIQGLFLGHNSKSFIDSFNLTAKYWFIRYLFKRTRDWGKWRSMLYTYLFIILWHGVLPGYWLAFLFEIPVITAEKQFTQLLVHYCGRHVEWHPVVRTTSITLARIYRLIVLGYGIQPFILLTWEDTTHVYGGLYWFIHLALAAWLFTFYFFLEHRLPRLSKQQQQSSPPSHWESENRREKNTKIS